MLKILQNYLWSFTKILFKLFKTIMLNLNSTDLMNFVFDSFHLTILQFHILSLYLNLGLKVGELTPEFGNLLKCTHTQMSI